MQFEFICLIGEMVPKPDYKVFVNDVLQTGPYPIYTNPKDKIKILDAETDTPATARPVTGVRAINVVLVSWLKPAAEY